MKITYHGHSCLQVEGNGKSIIIDPFLSGNPLATVKPEEIKADVIILTHGHSDHFGDTVEIARNNEALVIAVFELATICEQKGLKTHAMGLGGARDFGDFKVKFTPAFHSSSLPEGDGFVYTGMPAGVLLTIGGKTLYHAGDTALFGDMKLIGEMNRIDVAALPIGDNFTMGPEDASIAAHWLKANVVIPIHYNTFPPIEQDPEKFAELLKVRNIECRVLAPGQSFSLDEA